jgi:hypothetical protein
MSAGVLVCVPHVRRERRDLPFVNPKIRRSSTFLMRRIHGIWQERYRLIYRPDRPLDRPASLGMRELVMVALQSSAVCGRFCCAVGSILGLRRWGSPSTATSADSSYERS